MDALYFRATIKEGKVVPNDPSSYRDHLFRLEGKAVLVEVVEECARVRRTTAMNNLYRYYLRQVEQYTGQDVATIDRRMKKMFGIAHSSTLTIREFQIFMDKVKQFWAEMDCPLRDPEEFIG